MKIQRVVPCVAGARLGDKPMSGTSMTNDRIAEVMKRALDRERPPARLNGEQTADLLGFEKDDLALLARAGLLVPLGNPDRQCGEVLRHGRCRRIQRRSRSIGPSNGHYLFPQSVKVRGAEGPVARVAG